MRQTTENTMATKSATSNSANVPKPNGSAAIHKAPRTLAGNAQHDEAARKSAITLYEKALKLMYARKYSEAHTAFNAMLATAPQEFGDRIRMYISTCVGQIKNDEVVFKTPEERYDYAVSLVNLGHYPDAHQHFEAIRSADSTADYAFYGLALLASLTGDSEACIKHLSEAIRLNPQNRTQARLDSDFDGVSDDPRFTDLLYPEA
jgi:outer membrane protein assembly factor BamD (BamD/ComL family)